MENSRELKDLIRKNASLFWYSKADEKENLPLDVVVEFFINYASLETIKELCAIVGIQKVADIFFNQIRTQKERSNYFPVYQNYFTLLFNKYAS